MPAGAGYTLNIRAQDQATRTINAINKSLAGMSAPIERQKRAMAQFMDVSGLNKVGTAFGGVTHQVAGAVQRMNELATVMGVVGGAASVAGIYRTVAAWGDWGVHIDQTSKRLGIASTELTKLEGASRLAGTGTDAMDAGLRGLQQTLNDIMGGRAPLVQSLWATQNHITEFKDKTTGALLPLPKVLHNVADAVAGLSDPALQARYATMSLGSAGEALLPLLRQGGAALDGYVAEADKYNHVTPEMVQHALELAATQRRLTESATGLKNELTDALAPAVTNLNGYVTDLIQSNKAWLGAEVKKDLREFTGYLKSDDFKHLTDDARWFGQEVVAVTNALGGPEKALKLLVEFMAANWARKVITPWASLGWEIGGTAFRLSKVALAWKGVEGAATAAKAAQAAALGSETAATVAGVPAGPVVAVTAGAAYATYLNGQREAASLADGKSWTYDDASGAWIPPSGPSAAEAGSTAPHEGFMARMERAFGFGGGSRTPATRTQWGADMAQLQGYGWSRTQAAAILGNASQESEGDAGAVGDNRTAYGLMQWHGDRQAEFAKLFGHTMQAGTRAEQLQFANWEMTHTERAAGDALRATRDLPSGVHAVRALYERPADASGLEDTWRTDRALGILTGTAGAAAPAQMGTQAAPAQLATPATPGLTASDISGALGGALKGEITLNVQHSGAQPPGSSVTVGGTSDNVTVPGVMRTSVGATLP